MWVRRDNYLVDGRVTEEASKVKYTRSRPTGSPLSKERFVCRFSYKGSGPLHIRPVRKEVRTSVPCSGPCPAFPADRVKTELSR